MKWHYSLEQLVQEAMSETGLSDFGEPDMTGAFAHLLKSYREDIDFSEFGLHSFHVRFLMHLTNRLRLTEDRKRMPDIAAEKIARPIFITGLPRSGSSFLLDVLSQDPQSRVARTWEIHFSSPPPEASTYETDPRIAVMRARLEDLGHNDPDLQATHPWGESLPEECSFMVEQSFVSDTLASILPATQYTKWLATEADHGIAFRFHRRVLQNLQHKLRGDRWVLKAPSHMFHFQALLNEYPDARIILTHRDPLKVLPSVSSMAKAYQNLFLEEGGVNPLHIGENVNVLLSTATKHMMEVREHLGQSDQFCDILYEDLRTDPISIAEQIYAQFDIPLTLKAKDAMAKFVKEGNAKHGHGRHIYNLNDFGFKADDVYRDWQFYTDHYHIPIQK